jgi:hypothetical protein
MSARFQKAGQKFCLVMILALTLRSSADELPKINPSVQVPLASSIQNNKSDKMRSRLEQLFTWRVSDRLQLSPDDEIKFNEEFKKLSNEKNALALELEGLLEKIAQQKDNDKVTSKLMAEYQKGLKKNADLQIKELKEIKKLFGNRRLVQYVLLKKEMTQKFKDVLSQNPTIEAKNTEHPSPSSSPDEKLKDPEVIQEK